MKRLLFLSIVALLLVLTLIVRLPPPIVPAAASPSARPVATMPTVSAVGVVVTETTTVTVVVLPTITPTEPPVEVKPIEPPAEPPAQQGKPGKSDEPQYSYNISLSLKAKVLWPQYDINVVSYGAATIRDLNGKPVNDIGAENVMRLLELMAYER